MSHILEGDCTTNMRYCSNSTAVTAVLVVYMYPYPARKPRLGGLTLSLNTKSWSPASLLSFNKGPPPTGTRLAAGWSTIHHSWISRLWLADRSRASRMSLYWLSDWKREVTSYEVRCYLMLTQQKTKTCHFPVMCLLVVVLWLWFFYLSLCGCFQFVLMVICVLVVMYLSVDVCVSLWSLWVSVWLF